MENINSNFRNYVIFNELASLSLEKKKEKTQRKNRFNDFNSNRS